MRYVFSDYKVDTQLIALRQGGILCPLESQVFQVLVYLVQHRDQVVSKAEFLEYPWPRQYIGETTLSQRLMLVRQAVGDSSRRQRIMTTVPGHACRFVATVEEQTKIPPATVRHCLRGLRPCRPRQRGGRTSWRP